MPAAGSTGIEDSTSSRTFELTYGVEVKEIPTGSRLRVWLPVPQSHAGQDVAFVAQEAPVTPRQTTESRYGNRMLYFEAKPVNKSRQSFRVTWKITRHEVNGLANPNPNSRLADQQKRLFLGANAKVPIDGKPLTLVDPKQVDRSTPITLARTLYQQVDNHMRYDKSQPGYGHGDVLWACDSGFGNCTDFHSLFISWARAHDLPARFEIGFSIPKAGQGSIGGYHCWAQFHIDRHGWVPVDISEADKHPELKDYFFGNLNSDRVQFTMGRDITLEPPQDSGPLNYFIYPHIEVDGKEWPLEKTERKFEYQDLPATR
tara:strand:+ start:1567 stop:2514 length:948 start_codon:yes stop_codon:yes gene_type:complete